jgi:hypothetical protein
LNCSSTLLASSIVVKSESLPIMMLTKGLLKTVSPR